MKTANIHISFSKDNDTIVPALSVVAVRNARLRRALPGS